MGSVAKSIAEVNKLKKERKSSIYGLVVQGYIIFFIFMGIMLVMQFKIVPLTAGLSGAADILSASQIDITSQTNLNIKQQAIDLTRPFLYLLLVQGLLAGITIGKLAEGTIKAGLKHSFFLAASALLVSTGANLFLV